MNTAPRAGFFAALFDLSFTEHVAARLIRAFYPLVITVTVNVTTFWLLLAWALPHWVGWLVKGAIFIGAPITALTCLVLTRIALEYLIAIFTIDEKLTVLVKHTTSEHTTPAPIGKEQPDQ